VGSRHRSRPRTAEIPSFEAARAAKPGTRRVTSRSPAFAPASLRACITFLLALPLSRKSAWRRQLDARKFGNRCQDLAVVLADLGFATILAIDLDKRLRWAR